MFGLRKRVLFLKQYPEAGAWLQVQTCLHNNLCVKSNQLGGTSSTGGGIWRRPSLLYLRHMWRLAGARPSLPGAVWVGGGPFTGYVQCMPLCNRQGLGEPPLTADSGVDLAGLWLHYSCYEYSLIYTHNMFPHPLCFRKTPVPCIPDLAGGQWSSYKV